MGYNRRQFLGAASSTLALATLASRHEASDSEDPLGVRKDFPVTRDSTYLNAAYIAPIPEEVAKAGRSFVEAKLRRPISLGDMLRKTDEVRRQFADLVGAKEEEIGFLYATTEGENVVAHALDFKSGDNVVVDELHYEASYVLYGRLEQSAGVELRVVKQREGAVKPADFEPMVDARTRLISVAWVSHQNGFCHDMKGLARLAHSRGAYLYADAVQAVGMFPIDVKETGLDFMTSGTYKWLLAGYGVAPFYVRQDLLDRIPPDRRGAFQVQKDLGEYRYEIHRSAKKYEWATLAFGAVYQLGAALAYLKRLGVDRIGRHSIGLAHRLRKGLSDQGFRLFTPEGNPSSIVTFYFERDPEEVSRVFEAQGIFVTVRPEKRQVRVSAALFNNADEIDRFLGISDRLS